MYNIYLSIHINTYMLIQYTCIQNIKTIYAFTYTSKQINTHTCLQSCIYMNSYKCIYIYIKSKADSKRLKFKHPHINTKAYLNLYIPIHTYTHTNSHNIHANYLDTEIYIENKKIKFIHQFRHSHTIKYKHNVANNIYISKYIQTHTHIHHSLTT